MLETYGRPKEWTARIIKLLSSEGIKIRNKDGVLYSVEPSLSSDNSGFILELFYIKKDDTQTVDFFLINNDKGIKYLKTDREMKLIDKNHVGRHKMQITATISRDGVYFPPAGYNEALKSFKNFIKENNLSDLI